MIVGKNEAFESRHAFEKIVADGADAVLVQLENFELGNAEMLSWVTCGCPFDSAAGEIRGQAL